MLRRTDPHAFQDQEKGGVAKLLRQAISTEPGVLPRQSFRKGQLVYQAGEPAREIFLIEEGRVKEVSYSAEGKEFIKQVYNQHDVLGVGAILQDRRRHNYAITAASSVLYRIPLPALQRVMRQDAEINLFFMSLFSRNLIELENRLESIVFRSSRSRILDYLIDLIDRRGERVGYEWVIRRFMPHQEIASITATSRQTVNAVLNDLRRKDILTFNRRRLLVRDLDRLRKIAQLEKGAT